MPSPIVGAGASHSARELGRLAAPEAAVSMKAYVWITGILFVLIVASHVWRIVAERGDLLTRPLFMAITGVAAALAIWAFALLWKARRR